MPLTANADAASPASSAAQRGLRRHRAVRPPCRSGSVMRVAQRCTVPSAAIRAVAHHRQPVDPLLHLGQDVRGEDRRHAVIAQLAQGRVEVADASGSRPLVGSSRNSRCGLPSSACAKPRRWRMPLRIRAHRALRRRRPGPRARARRARRRIAAPFRRGEEAQRFEARKIVVEHDVLRQVADACGAPARKLRPRTGSPWIANVAGGRRHQPEHQLEQGRLAGAVVADQPEHLARARSRSTPSTACTAP